MAKATFLVDDIFSLTDTGVSLTGYVVEGVLKPGMKFKLANKSVSISKIQGRKKTFEVLDPKTSKEQEIASGLVLEGVKKKDLHDEDIYRGKTVVFSD